MAVAAVAVAAKYFSVDRSAIATRSRSKEVVVSSEPRWTKAAAVALPVASGKARLQVIEFVDVECPFCARYQATIDSIAQEFGTAIEIRIVNFPINGHRFAKSGAAALECADRQGAAQKMLRLVYANQDSIGFWPWTRFAAETAMKDTVSFKVCLSSIATRSAVDLASSTADSLDVQATPSVFVSDYRYNHAPSFERLARDIKTLIRGEKLK